MDFRGRIYPQPNIISHYGRDIERSLFVFNEKKLVGKDGLLNLKIYFSSLINGSKFMTKQQHVEFCDSFYDIIFQTAINSKQNLWWLKHEKAFQILAVCKEIYYTVNYDDYTSGFPIYIDATCSSFQHVAALTRDSKIAKHLL